MTINIDRDERHASVWRAVEDWRDLPPDPADAITEHETRALWRSRVPGASCWTCWAQIQAGGCDEHRSARAHYFARRSA